jgi:hypothetical protein
MMKIVAVVGHHAIVDPDARRSDAASPTSPCTS